MTIALYREGNTHTAFGIECEIGRFPTNKLEARLKEGWVVSPEDINGEKQEEDKAESEEEAEGLQKLNPIRLKAKEAGIDGWDSKRIKTLEAALDVTES